MEYCECFLEIVIVEMCGVSDEEGCLLFWEWLEIYFFFMDFFIVDYLIGIGNKVFIVEFMLKYLIYVNLFSKEV